MRFHNQRGFDNAFTKDLDRLVAVSYQPMVFQNFGFYHRIL
ncbi:uncharacterized protein METZ01_LOCUS331946, partial [marine metagenome]